MDFDTAVVVPALIIGGIQMYQTFDKVRKTGTSKHTKSYVIMSIVASVLWMIYQFRRSGMNFTFAYTGIGLALQIYILTEMQKGLNPGLHKDADKEDKE